MQVKLDREFIPRIGLPGYADYFTTTNLLSATGERADVFAESGLTTGLVFEEIVL